VHRETSRCTATAPPFKNVATSCRRGGAVSHRRSSISDKDLTLVSTVWMESSKLNQSFMHSHLIKGVLLKQFLYDKEPDLIPFSRSPYLEKKSFDNSLKNFKKQFI
jgi:hypothetical protein